MNINQLWFTRLSGLLAFGLIATQSVRAADAAYHLLKEIPVSDGGKWTAMAVDEAGRRLYAAHGSRIEIIDLNDETPTAAIANLPEVSGFVVAPSFHLGFASSGKARLVSLVDLRTLKTATTMKTGADPAAVVYEPSKSLLFVFNQGDHSMTVGEADDGDFMGGIDLGGKPSSAITDTKATFEKNNGRLFCSLADKNEIVAIDVGTHKLKDHWPVAPGQSPGSLAYDAAHHRLWVACANKLLVLLDSTNGKVLATAPIGAGAGSVVYDAATQNAFCATADGTLTILHEDAPDKLTVLQTLKTTPGASVLGLDGKTHRIYVGSADLVGTGADPVPKSSKILVYGS